MGEASHPGPRSDVPDDILDDLEFRLGRMHRGDGRNVVPRRAMEDVESSVPVTATDSANLRSRIQRQGTRCVWASEASQAS